MDSVTQAVLGAAVAEAGFGRQLGNKALAWGLALGTLPDLDVLVYPWLDQIGRLEWHRGLSHSLLVMTLAAPLLGWIVSRIHGGAVGWLRAALTVWAILFTHVLIDVFTVYGTVVFAPFSDLRVGFNNLFIIDPLFTLPLLVGVLAAFFLRRDDRWRFRWNTFGLVLSSLYVVWSLGAKSVATDRIEKALADQGLPAVRLQTAPTPFNTLLWRGLAEGPEGFWIGYYSLLQPGQSVEFFYVPKNHEALGSLAGTRSIERIRWFSNGFFSAKETPEGLVVSDWRFGEFPQPGGGYRTMFSWAVPDSGDEITPLRAKIPSNALAILAARLLPIEAP